MFNFNRESQENQGDVEQLSSDVGIQGVKACSGALIFKFKYARTLKDLHWNIIHKETKMCLFCFSLSISEDDRPRLPQVKASRDV